MNFIYLLLLLLLLFYRSGNNFPHFLHHWEKVVKKTTQRQRSKPIPDSEYGKDSGGNLGGLHENLAPIRFSGDLRLRSHSVTTNS